MLLGTERLGASLDFKNDQVLVRGGGLVPNVLGTVQQAIDASVIAYTRATGASRVNASGLLETVSSGVWRRQYDPLTLSPLGYLPEPARTNLELYSDDFANAAWTKTSVTITSDAYTSPAGPTSMDRAEETGAGALLLSAAAVTVVAGSTYTTTRYFKRGNCDWVRITVGSSGSFTSSVRAWFNLATGAVGSQIAALWTYVSHSIEDVGGGIYRCRLTYTVVTNTTLYVATCSASADSSLVKADIGGGAGVGVQYGVWGAQSELGAYPTSYIPTTSATVTRNADDMTSPLSKLPFNAAAGTIITTAQPPHDETSTIAATWMLDAGSSANCIRTYNGTAGNKARTGNVQISSSSVAAIVSANNVSAARFKEAFTWAANDFELVANGSSQGTDPSGALPTPTTLRIGRLLNGADVNWLASPIESLVHIPRRLTSAEMITRTAV